MTTTDGTQTDTRASVTGQGVPPARSNMRLAARIRDATALGVPTMTSLRKNPCAAACAEYLAQTVKIDMGGGDLELRSFVFCVW